MGIIVRMCKVGRFGLILFLFASGCSNKDEDRVGANCGGDSTCAKGLTCDLAIPGGYCTKPCTLTGQTNECPGGAICDTVEGARTECVRICQTTADCNAPLECNGVSKSNIKACKPKGSAADGGTADGKKP
jgi:hypothetical protein